LQNSLQIDSELLLYLPFMVGPLATATCDAWPSFEERGDFMFIGTGKHAPNLDAIKWLKTQIWPLIREGLPVAKCYIYGSYLPEHIMQMHQPQEGFFVVGTLDDVAARMCTKRINLAPLRFGAGLKGKLVAGMLNGTPNVTTPIGAEGMHDNLSWNGIIATTAAEFARAAISLYNDPLEWKTSQQNGKILIDALYDRAAHQKKLRFKLEAMASDLSSYRNRNFIGAMLHHHTMSSTKYMAKWITEKNKR